MDDLAILLIGIILITGGFTIIDIGGLSKGIFIDLGVAASPIGVLCFTFGIILVVYYFKKKIFKK